VLDDVPHDDGVHAVGRVLVGGERAVSHVDPVRLRRAFAGPLARFDPPDVPAALAREREEHARVCADLEDVAGRGEAFQPVELAAERHGSRILADEVLGILDVLVGGRDAVVGARVDDVDEPARQAAADISVLAVR